MFAQRSRPAILGIFCTALSIALCAAPRAPAGTLAYFPITDDASSQIAGAKTYTHTLDFGENTTAPVASVNGVQFENGSPGAFYRTSGSGIVGTGSTNQPNSHAGNGINSDPTIVTGNVRNLVDDFVYNAPSTVIQLTGLTVGQTYDLRLYHRQWDGPGDRRQRFGFDTNGVGDPEDTIPTLNPDDASQVPPGLDRADRVHALSYAYTAESPTLTVTATRLGTGSYHLYGLTNELVGPPAGGGEPLRRVRSAYHSGVDDFGRVLTPGSQDPHYTVMTVPDGSSFAAPGASIVQQNNSAWLANDPVGSPGSSWTSTVASGADGIPSGTYVTRTTFDLSGFLPETARVHVALAGDDNVVDVLFNGASLGITGNGFTGWREFLIPAGSGFHTINNTLDFVWENTLDSPGGLRVELAALAQRRGTTSIPGLFNTGVDDNGDPLPGGAVDLHYVLAVNPDGGGTDALVQQNLPAAWLPNRADSQWIGPQSDTSASSGGEYLYEATFDLTGFYPATAEITGMWASDNAGLEILLNGSVVHAGNAQYGTLASFTIPVGSPFVEGINTLAFRVNNAGTGYTGLRIEDLAGTAVKVPEPSSLALFALAALGLLAFVPRRRPTP